MPSSAKKSSANRGSPHHALLLCVWWCRWEKEKSPLLHHKSSLYDFPLSRMAELAPNGRYPFGTGARIQSINYCCYLFAPRPPPTPHKTRESQYGNPQYPALGLAHKLEAATGRTSPYLGVKFGSAPRPRIRFPSTTGGLKRVHILEPETPSMYTFSLLHPPCGVRVHCYFPSLSIRSAACRRRRPRVVPSHDAAAMRLATLFGAITRSRRKRRRPHFWVTRPDQSVRPSRPKAGRP